MLIIPQYDRPHSNGAHPILRNFVASLSGIYIFGLLIGLDGQPCTQLGDLKIFEDYQVTY